MDEALPIENYAIIGDLNTTALVGLNGSIDFFCFPRFDSPSVFARLLDAEKGGYFSISPRMQHMKPRQIYLPDTNVLLSRFLSPDGIVEIIDCMPVCAQGNGQQIIRTVRVIKGEMPIRMKCYPRFNYGRTEHRFESLPDAHRVVITPLADVQPVMRLHSEYPLVIEGDGITADFVLKAGQSAHFYLEWRDDGMASDTENLDELLQRTISFWRDWIAQGTYQGRWREMVMRSALLLKLLTFHDTGAVVAAPTFGLPEAIDGKRNWDYRYCWIRDSAFTMYALMRLGFHQESVDYMQWIEERLKESKDADQLHLMYRLDGSNDIEEEILSDWSGYRNSRPVRIGNEANKQRQLDIYGELLDSIYLSNKYVQGISHDGWMSLIRKVDYVCEHWNEADRGIWEMRGEPQQFAHSRLMCWVAVDRALKLAIAQSLPAPIPRWAETRTKINLSIFDDFWDEELQSFVQYKGGKNVDASLLMMPMVKFIAATDPRWLSTLERIGHTLGTDALIQRYKAEKVNFEGIDQSTEGSFTMCSFWYIECLARAGRVDEAQLLFEKMLAYANHVGLYAEELGIDGSHLGNFPQAFTHLALISAAYALNLKLDKDTLHSWRF